MAHSYAWERQSSVAPLLASSSYGGSARGRKWTVVAAVCSVAFHIALFYGLRQFPVTPLATLIDATEITRNFNVERATIDPALLEPESGGGGSSLDDAASAARDAFSAKDLEDLADEDPGELLGRDLIATPGADLLDSSAFEPTASSETAAAAIDALTDSIGAASDSDFASALEMAQTDLVEFTPSSPQQPVIVTGIETALDEDSAALLASLAADTAASLSPASSGAEVPEGYASLDDLMAYDGPDIDDKPIMMPTDLLFGSNEDTLRESAKASLMKLAFIVQKNPGATFTVEGHTDSFGSAEYNQSLSERRADAVRDWLVDTLQLEPDRFRVAGYGKLRPIVEISGDSEAQSLNRRVEIVVTQDGEVTGRESIPRAEPITPTAR